METKYLYFFVQQKNTYNCVIKKMPIDVLFLLTKIKWKIYIFYFRFP